MSKTTMLNVRVDPEIKSQAEAILSSLGISKSAAIDMYLRQTILKQEIPFSLNCSSVPDYLNPDKVTLEELAVSIQRGHDDIASGKYYNIDESYQYLKEKYKNET